MALLSEIKSSSYSSQKINEKLIVEIAGRRAAGRGVSPRENKLSLVSVSDKNRKWSPSIFFRLYHTLPNAKLFPLGIRLSGRVLSLNVAVVGIYINLIHGSDKSENQKEKTNSTLNSQPHPRHSTPKG